MGHEELIDFCLSHKRIFCYGAGQYAMTIREFMQEHQLKLERFVVTEKNGQSDYFMELPVDSIFDVMPVRDDVGIIIGVGETKHAEIIDILRRYEFENYFAVTKTCFIDVEHYTEYDNLWFDNGRDICVLLYHRVCKLPLDVWGLAISPDVFEKHIKFYKENYNIIDFDGDWFNVEKPSLIITFDDGYADNLQYALPILEKYKVPATIFVSTGNIGTDREFWWDELERIIFFNNKDYLYFEPLDEKFAISNYKEKENACRRIRLFLKGLLPEDRNTVLQKLMGELGSDKASRRYNRSLCEEELCIMASSPYITIGGHTVTHNMLSAQGKEDQEWEIVSSKQRIEEIIDGELSVFSYPFGGEQDINEYSIESVRKAGYKRAGTTSFGLANKDTCAFTIPRNSMPFFSKEKELRKQLKKIYSLF